MCLIKGLENQPCIHWWCNSVAKKPQYFAFLKSDLIKENEGLFQQFTLRPAEILQGKVIKPYIYAINAFCEGSKEWNDFESFKQSNSIEAYGKWPSDRSTFDKSEVDYIFIEYTSSTPSSINLDTELNTFEIMAYQNSLDVKEVAVYIGKDALCV
jgi:hypothetical protein